MTMPSEKPAGLNHGIGENRRASKPLIEKRRRARINQSLAELKSLVIDTKKEIHAQNTRPPKLEKADILELTVAHLRNLHEYIAQSPTSEGDDNSYKAGFSRCLQEVYQFIERETNLNRAQKHRLLSHLTNVGPVLLSQSSPDSASIAMEDSASSCSSNSRSGTPLIIDPMDYLPCSPVSDSNQDVSSTSSSSPSNSRVLNGWNKPDHKVPCSRNVSSNVLTDFNRESSSSPPSHSRLTVICKKEHSSSSAMKMEFKNTSTNSRELSIDPLNCSRLTFPQICSESLPICSKKELNSNFEQKVSSVHSSTSNKTFQPNQIAHDVVLNGNSPFQRDFNSPMCNSNGPLNLASSSRDSLIQSQYSCTSNGNRTSVENFDSTNRYVKSSLPVESSSGNRLFVLRSPPNHMEASIAQMDPVWRPW